GQRTHSAACRIRRSESRRTLMTAVETNVAVREPRSGQNPLKLKRIHHVEFLAGNAKQSAYFYRKAFGFSQVAYAGLETGNREATSYVLAQGKIRFVITSPLRP